MSYFGDIRIGRMPLGDVEITKAFLGDDLVFQKGGTPPEPPTPSRLPAGYTEVEYIENTTTAFINTGIIYPCTWTITAQANAVPATNQILVGSKTSAGHYVGAITNGYWGTTTNASYYIAGYPNTARTQLTITINRKSVEFSAEDSATKTHNATSNIDTAIWLFAASKTASSTYPFIGKVYGDVVGVKEGVEVFRGVPCTDPNGVAGLYDLVSEAFFGSANTATFAAGPAIN